MDQIDEPIQHEHAVLRSSVGLLIDVALPVLPYTYVVVQYVIRRPSST